MSDSMEQKKPDLRGKVGCIMFTGVLISVIIVTVIAILLGFYEKESNLHPALVYNMFYLAMGLVAVFLIRYFNISGRALTGSYTKFKENIRYSFLVFPLILISIGTAVLILYTMSFISEDMFYFYLEMGNNLIEWPAEASPLFHVLMFICIVVLAPVVEEYLFRGILLSSWTVKWGPARAIILTSFIFGMLHADPVGAFFVGIVLALIYLKTGSLLLVIFIHMLNNGLAVFFMFGFPNLMEFETPDDVRESFWYIMVLMILSAVVIWPMIRNLWREKSSSPPLVRDK
ncbi:MAG: CPBP family intramembrane glutamic endopeptidase [Bacteroidales bacterium]